VVISGNFLIFFSDMGFKKKKEFVTIYIYIFSFSQNGESFPENKSLKQPIA